MKITKSSFVISVAKSDKIIIDNRKQIAFVGRSNVGKSSLINMLTNNGKLAKTSSLPGRTRLINYFLINDDFYFVDLPGYGYAKASKEEVYGWQGLIEPYLQGNDQLKCVCMLVDIRHEPTAQDKEMFNYLSHYQIPFMIIATKSDKLSRVQINNSITRIANTFGVGRANVFACSSEKKDGASAILTNIEEKLKF